VADSPRGETSRCTTTARPSAADASNTRSHSCSPPITDIGYESGTTVSPDYTTGTSRFTGTIRWVQLDLGDDDHDHYIDPEERLRVAMSRR
jgi:hypothetical protein